MSKLRTQLQGAKESSSLVLRTVELPGRRTSLKLEPLMWAALERVCAERDLSPSSFIAEVEERKLASSLTSGVRVALLEHFWQVAEAGEQAPQDGLGPRREIGSAFVGPDGKPGGKPGGKPQTIL